MSNISKSRHELESEGWKLASITGGNHLKRILDMYQELDIEVYLLEIGPDDCDRCTECFTAGNETIYAIYTRQKHI